jgi:hypothetical protein
LIVGQLEERDDRFDPGVVHQDVDRFIILPEAYKKKQ